VHYLRTLDDAVALRDALDGAGRVVVVGAGFIGSEVASSACARGCDVTVLEATASPMSRVFGHDMGTRIGALHRHSGSELRCGVAVVGAEAKQSRVKIRLSDSSAIEADVVVVGVGSVPNSEWLSSSFDLSGDGVACDSRGRVRGDDGVHALGDVASWASERYGDCQRSEHWTSAGDQAVVVAADIVGRTGPDEAVPYVWSDQFSHRIQVCGRWFPDAQVRVLRDEGVSLLAISGRGGRLEGAVSIDDAKGFATLRRALIRGSSLEMAAGTISALLS
jgi:NADPH-dependent 2,4-dienoyl-CoA reductase/sulfur reductase-like enzyme